MKHLMKTFRFTLSNILILSSIIVFWLSTIFPWLYNLWMNSYYLEQSDITGLVLQCILYSFLHWSILHILMNSIFVYYFWNQAEDILGKKKYFIFFVLNTIFVGIGLLLFASGNTIGMSGFALAVLSYFTLHLRGIWNPEYQGWITAIIINLLIGLSPGISFFWHLFWALFGIIFYFFYRIIKKRA
jgi:membrane associated rhomboid family serine protease